MANGTLDFEYVICTRRAREGAFTSEPGATTYLKVPHDRNPQPGDKIRPRRWFDEVQDRADGMADNKIDPAGDVLVFIHGYNNDQDIVMKRHRQLQTDLWAEGFRGLVVSFDWPSASSTVNYLEDRWDASETAIRLVTDGVMRFAARQRAGCDGDYIVRKHLK